MPQVDLPPPVWDMFSRSEQPLHSVLDPLMNVKPELDTATGLPYVFPVQFYGNPTSELPATCELFGGPVGFCPSWQSSITMSAICSSPSQDAQSNLRRNFFLDFTGRLFDVEAMAFELYEDKMEFENYDLVINMPGQESILTTESFDFFLDRVFRIQEGVQSNGGDAENVSDLEKDHEHEFIEEKLEFEEHDLAISMPGQESILNTENVGILCLKLIAWMASDTSTENAVMKSSSETSSGQECSLEECKETCHRGSNTNSLASRTLKVETPAKQSSTQNNLAQEINDEHNPMPVKSALVAASRAVPVKVTPVPVKVTPAPVKVTPAPVKVTPVPVKVTPVPVEVTPVPVKVTPAPVKVTPAPVKVTPVPVKVTPVPVKVTPVPVEVTLVPVKVTPVPVKVTPVPGESCALPRENASENRTFPVEQDNLCTDRNQTTTRVRALFSLCFSTASAIGVIFTFFCYSLSNWRCTYFVLLQPLRLARYLLCVITASAIGAMQTLILVYGDYPTDHERAVIYQRAGNSVDANEDSAGKSDPM